MLPQIWLMPFQFEQLVQSRQRLLSVLRNRIYQQLEQRGSAEYAKGMPGFPGERLP